MNLAHCPAFAYRCPMPDSSVVTSPTQLLLPEAALAARIIRSGDVSHELLRWLSSPTQSEGAPSELESAELVDAIDEIIAPLVESASGWERRQVEYASPYLAATCKTVFRLYTGLRLGIGPRMLAASLLPLYRSLATGDLHNGFEQTRHRLFETISLLLVGHYCEPDFVEWFERPLTAEQSPYEILEENLQLNLVGIGAIVRRHVFGFDTDANDFTEESGTKLEQLNSNDLQRLAASYPAWAAPDLLWRMAGELISHRSELVLPRSWIDTPVPWQSIGDHWGKLSLLLASTHRSPSKEQELASAPTAESTPAASEDTPETEASTASAVPEEDYTAIEEEPSVVEPSPEIVLPKVFIAEIMSHNDPAFVKLVHRQLATCRAEAREISLASLTVSPESETGHKELNGSPAGNIRPWQQKLANFLGDHPDVGEPYAFITSDHQLWLCLLDVERNETTNLLRDALSQLLGNSAAEDDGVLATVKPPARYQVGIASASAPNGGLSPQQLVEATCRCLSAAACQNKSSIKSIEVF